MNFYPRHVGDYAKDAGHLSLLEHGLYSRLLDVYYTREGPIPEDQVERLIGARSKDEITGLKVVLGEFFSLADGAWHQKRCNSEIARYQDKQAKAKRSANARWGAKPMQSGSNANASPDALQMQCSPEPEPNPIANSQENDTPSDSPLVASSSFEGPGATAHSAAIIQRAIELAVLLRKRGAAVTGSNPDVLKMAEDGASDAEALSALKTAQAQRSANADTTPINGGYLLAIYRASRTRNSGRDIPATSPQKVRGHHDVVEPA